MAFTTRIDTYICDLLYYNDCVIIPGFGGFVANSRGSFLNPAQHTFTPPVKRIAFNSSLKINDGLLAHHICRKMNISYQEGNVIVQRFVEECLLKLNSGSSVVIENIGKISFDHEQHLQFEPDTNINFLLSSFGLTTVHSPAIKRSGDKEVIVKDGKKVNVTKKKGKVIGWKFIELIPAAAALALMIFHPQVIPGLNKNLSSIIPTNSIFQDNNVAEVKDESIQKYSYFAGEKNESNKSAEAVDNGVTEITPSATNNNLASTDTEEKSSILNQELINTTYQRMQAAFDKEVEAETNLILSEEKSSIIETKHVDVAPSVHTYVATTSDTKLEKKHYLIGGCFSVEENAQKFLAESLSKGFQSAIIGKNKKGMYMVSLFETTNKEEVLKKEAEIESQTSQSLWVYSN